MNYEDIMIKGVQEGYINYLSTSSRSNKKVKSIHLAFANCLQHVLGNEFEVRCLGKGEEYTYQGKNDTKKIDVTVFKDGIPLLGDGVKNVQYNGYTYSLF